MGIFFIMLRSGSVRLNLGAAALLTMLALSARAQPPGDSLRPYPMAGVEVTSTRIASRSDRSPLRTTVLNRSAFEQGSALNIGDVLKLTPGMVVREYGGGGGIQMLSFRGMGAEHTLVLVDGLPSNNIQTGVVDLRMLPFDAVESVEIIRGGSSALYGSNAVGGVINIRTDAAARAPHVRFSGGWGPFGALQLSASASAALDGARLSAGVRRERGSGRFPVRMRSGAAVVEGLRLNSDHLLEQLFGRADFFIEGAGRGWLSVSATTVERGSPGPLTSLAAQGDGRLSDAAVVVSGSYESKLGSKFLAVIAGSAQRADEEFQEASGPFRGNNSYRNVTLAASPLIRYDGSPNWSIRSGMDIDRASANGNALPGAVHRTHAAWFATSELRTDTMGSFRAVVALLPAIRAESFSSSSPFINPQIGLDAHLDFGAWELTLRSSVGSNFRVPTMNELHYAGAGGFGNPDLVPEAAVNFDAGVGIDADAGGRISFDATLYAIRTLDRIVWQPATSAFIWSPVNIAESESHGFELEASWTASSDHVEIRGSYAFIDARNTGSSSGLNPAYGKQLPYVPLETASTSLQLRIPVSDGVFRRILARLEDQYIGERFTTEDNTSSLPGTHVLGASVGLAAAVSGGTIHAAYHILNLGDRDVETIPGYPMPLRHHAISFTFEHYLRNAP